MERWEKVMAVQRMQDYIEEHLNEPITLRQLAQAAHYSPWHAARIFKDMTEKSPIDYIRSRRLSEAALRLQEPEVRVVDVALDFVFDSHEGFTRAFSKQFGMSPRYYTKHAPPIRLFLPSNVRNYYLNLQKGVDKLANNSNLNTVYVQVVERPARKLLLKRGKQASHYFEYCDEVGCDIWDVLSNIKEALYEPIGMWLPDNLRLPDTSVYAQGVELPTDYAGEIPLGYELIDLQPCSMMVFQGQPYDDEKFTDAIADLWEVMNAYNPTVYGFNWADEDGPRFQLAPMGYRGYIEARPVRPLNP